VACLDQGALEDHRTATPKSRPESAELNWGTEFDKMVDFSTFPAYGMSLYLPLRQGTHKSARRT
jgi:hypothetical protein